MIPTPLPNGLQVGDAVIEPHPLKPDTITITQDGRTVTLNRSQAGTIAWALYHFANQGAMPSWVQPLDLT
jgi:hypothetical protein